MPSRNKHRWAKLRRSAVPKRFHFVGLSDGRAIVYRGQNAFDWGPIDVDRDALRRLLGTLNGLPVCDACSTVRRWYTWRRRRVCQTCAYEHARHNDKRNNLEPLPARRNPGTQR